MLAYLLFSCMLFVSSCKFVLYTVYLYRAPSSGVDAINQVGVTVSTQEQNVPKMTLFGILPGLHLGEENREGREAGLSAKRGTVARTRKRSVINTVQTNCTPYGVPSRLLHSKTTCNMPTIDPQLHTGSHTPSHKTHTWFCCVSSPQAINPDRICRLKWWGLCANFEDKVLWKYNEFIISLPCMTQ